jgi:hypothetical protein
MNDITISATNSITKNTAATKPVYLVIMEEAGKTKSVSKCFITLDRPDTEVSFVKMKGFYVDGGEEDVTNNYQELLTSINREAIIELMVPWVRIHKIKSLVFKAK